MLRTTRCAHFVKIKQVPRSSGVTHDLLPLLPGTRACALISLQADTFLQSLFLDMFKVTAFTLRQLCGQPPLRIPPWGPAARPGVTERGHPTGMGHVESKVGDMGGCGDAARRGPGGDGQPCLLPALPQVSACSGGP